MKNAFLSLNTAFSYLVKNKINFVLMLIPVIMGILLYVFLGSFFYESAMELGNQYVEEYLGNGTKGSIAYYAMATVLTVLLFFIVNWTFVLVVSILASPFNDILSERIEKLHNGQELVNIGSSLSSRFGRLPAILFNELKKITFIISLVFLSLLLSIIPLLSPITIILSILLLCIEFVDYSWSRHQMSFSDCLKDLKGNLFGYLFGGGLFFAMVSIPFINLFVPSMATSFFTVFWVKNHANSNKST